MANERIVFLGTPELAAECLKGLVKANFNIVGVVTKEDKIRGRNNTVEESPVAKVAHEFNLPLHKPHRLNTDFQFLVDLKPDLLLTFAYGQLISDEILALGTYKPLNLHGSLLPKYRGAAPMQYALYNGDKQTGVSLMEMVHEMDAGDVYASKSFTIDIKDNYTTLCKKMSQCGLELAIDALPKYFNHELTPIPQDKTKVTFTHMITKEQEHLDLSKTPLEFVNQVRSLSLTPGGYLLWNDQMLKIYEAEVFSDKQEAEIGTVVLAHKKQIILQVKEGQVKLNLLQRPGKKMMSTSDFNNGVHDFTGVILH